MTEIEALRKSIAGADEALAVLHREKGRKMRAETVYLGMCLERICLAIRECWAVPPEQVELNKRRREEEAAFRKEQREALKVQTEFMKAMVAEVKKGEEWRSREE